LSWYSQRYNEIFWCFILIFFFFLEKWSPALQIRTVLLSIQALLSAPNPDDFLDADVAEKWKADERGAKAIGILISHHRLIFFSFNLARDWTQKYAHES
jgi:hypothetical protein